MKKKNPNNTICLCAIVRDEAKVIGRLIDSCKDFIDYWVIVDTGSKDNTIEIIREKLSGVPGELHENKWVSFGHNRTELLNLANGKSDYLLLADADFEYLLTAEFVKKFTHNAYHLRYVGEIDYAQILFIKSGLNWRYIGSTHEFITADGIGTVPMLSTIKVIHHADGGTRHEKLDRDIALLEKSLAENPNDARSHFYLAQTYANKGVLEVAIKHYTERAKLAGWPEEVFYSLFQIGVLQKQLGNRDSAIAQLHEAYTYMPKRFEPMYVIGLIFREKKQYHLAQIYFEQVIKMPYPADCLLFVHKQQREFLAHFELAICKYWMEEYEEALIHARIVEANPNIPEDIRKQNVENLGFINNKIEKKKAGNNDIVYCSMFTVGTPYEDEIAKLKKSADEHDIYYEFVGLKDTGSWEKNTQMKPGVIKMVMEKYNKDVVWIDADAVFLKKPTFFDTIDADISYYKIKEWNEILTGTLYFKNNSLVKELLDNWDAVNKSNNNPDGYNFQKLIEANETTFRVVDLPPDYIKIFDNELIPAKDPVIIHNQASRRLKAARSNGTVKKMDGVKNSLLRLVKKVGKDYCSVIGNGPSDSFLGNKIDGSFVIRCNDFRPGVAAKIGSKTDLNASSLYKPICPTKKVPYEILGVLPISDTLYQQYTTAKEMHTFWIENGREMISMGNSVWMYGDQDSMADLFTEVASFINAFPTVGIMAIAVARWLGFKEIIVTGFTFFKGEQSHYWTKEKVEPSSHHNPSAEGKLLLKWIGEDSGRIEYVLDDLTIKSLHRNYASVK